MIFLLFESYLYKCNLILYTFSYIIICSFIIIVELICVDLTLHDTY